ncbi:MAG: ergothioneine biosynthesis protein EgtB [Gammaproteobacteria bacterium]|nr:ergothioneine biosynthesis protein EgtB [Gammaproteobacteria bacterium]
MSSLPHAWMPAEQAGSLSASYQRIRNATIDLTRTLEPEDFVVQTMPDVSPTKWHLAHTTWFFEHFLLRPNAAGYRPFDEQFDFLFNSYYYSVGQMHLRPERGFLSRPTVRRILEFRNHVDEAMTALLDSTGDDPEIAKLTTLGINHEQQHRELLLTDIKHVFSRNPMLPALRDTPAAPHGVAGDMRFVERNEGIREIGARDDGFFFDNETPRHRVLLARHALGARLVTNAEYREFVDDGGYRRTDLWLSDGWAAVQREGWDRPLYWSEDLAQEFTLGGLRELVPDAPVAHVSYYEADAFARWAGARLPTEMEWETAAEEQAIKGNFLESGLLHPSPNPVPKGEGEKAPSQMFGDVWEWTQSAYMPYPGFKPLAGSLGEYNGKFMCNQWVVRGGSCATSRSHIRASYRSFFYPHQRWQFLGIRLAKDL